MTDSRDHALRALGDQMDNAQIGATARYWSLCEKQERGEHPSADYPMLVGLTGRRFTRLMFGVVLQELTRRPGLFTQAIAALSNGIAREIGEALQVFPFAERVNAFNGLARQLSEGLQIGFAEKVDLPPASVTGWQTMETAPKDGTLVDLWIEGRRVPDAYWGEPAEDAETEFHELGWLVAGEYARGEDEVVSHWRPRPEPPGAA